MAPLTPPDPERVGTARGGHRWLVAPILVVAFVAVAIAKPWGDRRSAALPATTADATASVTGVVPAATPTLLAPRMSFGLPRIIAGDGRPGAAEIVSALQIDTVPWANELAADEESAWVWSDEGVIRRVRADGDGVTLVSRIDLGPSTGGPTTSIGARGIAMAWSQVWAADPGHHGLARIERGAERVVDRIELPSVDLAGGTSPDRWADSSGFAIDGDSIFVPSLDGPSSEVAASASSPGALWRVDTSTHDRPGWIALDRPTGVAVGFGSVWVVTCCGDHSDARTYTIVRLEEQTGGVQARITLPAYEVSADGRPVIRIGPDSVWVGLSDAAFIVRIDPATSAIRSTIGVELPVTDLAIGPGGAVWATESEPWYRFGAVVSDRCQGILARIDPSTEAVVARTTIACPMSVAVAGDDVWVGSAGTEGRGTSGGQPPLLYHLRAIESTP